LPALRVYHSRKGHIKMKRDFQVPVENYYPQATWDFKLGFTLQGMRCRKDYHTQVKAHWPEMQRLGFEYPKKRKAAFSSSEEAELIRGLEMHKECVGHTLVTGKFDPRSVVGWPEEDLPLGKLVKKARKLYKTEELADAVIERLAARGMVWNLSAFKTKVFPALQRYKELNGDMEVPKSFKVPTMIHSGRERVGGLL
jgi:hypothetical protein